MDKFRERQVGGVKRKTKRGEKLTVVGASKFPVFFSGVVRLFYSTASEDEIAVAAKRYLKYN